MFLYQQILDYLNYLEEKNYSQATIRRRRGIYLKYLQSHDVLSLEYIYDYTKNYGKSRNAILSDLKQLMKYLEMLGEIQEGTHLKIEFPKQIKSLPKIIYSQKEILKHLTHLPAETKDQRRHKLLCNLLYATGIRIGELVNLKLKDLDLNSKRLWIRQGKGKKDRVVPLQENMILLIKDYLNEHPQIHSNNLLQYRDKNLRAWKINKVIRLYFPKEFTAHSFRHHLAVHLLENGADVRYIQALLGHEDIKTTTIYLKLSPQKLEKAYRNNSLWSDL